MFKVVHTTVKQIVSQNDKLALMCQDREKLFVKYSWSHHTHKLIIFINFHLVPQNLEAEHS